MRRLARAGLFAAVGLLGLAVYRAEANGLSATLRYVGCQPTFVFEVRDDDGARERVELGPGWLFDSGAASKHQAPGLAAR